jgi:hypothetical protein
MVKRVKGKKEKQQEINVDKKDHVRLTILKASFGCKKLSQVVKMLIDNDEVMRK